MGYGRIETEAGGAAHLAMPELNSGAIDKVTDARANSSRAERGKRSATSGHRLLYRKPTRKICRLSADTIDEKLLMFDLLLQGGVLWFLR